MPPTKSRIVGSGFSTLSWQSKPLAILQNFRDSGQQLMGGDGGAGWEQVISIGSEFPDEIVQGEVMGAGQLTFSLLETWNAPAWYQFFRGAGAVDDGSLNNIVDIVKAQRASGTFFTAQLLIKPPPGAGIAQRGKNYQNVSIVGVDDSETVTVGALTIPRNITAVYTHYIPVTNPSAR